MIKKVRITLFAALLTVASFGAAVPVSAQPNGQTTEKKSCTGPNGEQYTHGSTYVTYIKVGDKLKTAYTYKCNDGKWEQVASVLAPSTTSNISSTTTLNFSRF